MNDTPFILPDHRVEKIFPKAKHAGNTINDSYPQVQKREPLLLVLPAPPLPLNQGYRLAAYNDIIQLSQLRDLHILICNGKIVYDFQRDSYELNYKELTSVPSIKSVSFIELNADWGKPFRERILRQVSVLLSQKRLLEDGSAYDLTQKVIGLCSKYDIKEIHLGITINLFVDVFLNLRACSNYRISFTAHDIDADKVLIRMKENLKGKKIAKVITNWFTYRIFLWKEIHACKMSRFVISMAYRDFERLSRKKVNVFFIPPYLHTLPTNHVSKKLSQKPTLLIFGHIAFSAAGNGIEQFMEEVVPAVKKKVPGVVIKIVGRDASSSVISKCELLGVHHQEYIEDSEELWDETTVLASPLLVSKGIRIRILEAVCRGIPVVCTQQSATGFLHPEEFLRVTSDFNLFADYCIELLTNAKKYRLEQQRINAYFRKNLSEDIIKLKWEHVWQKEPPYPPVSSSLKKYKEAITKIEEHAYETNYLPGK